MHNSNPVEFIEDEIDDVKHNTSVLNLSNLLDFLQKLNDYLDREEEFDRNARKIRRIIFKHNILTHKLIPFYKYILTKLNSDTQYEKFILKPRRLLDDHKELISCIKLVKNLNEILKLLVDLTSPSEFLNINHNFIFSILSRFDLIVKNNSACIDIPNVLDEINRGVANTPDISELIEQNVNVFKEKVLKFEITNLMGESYRKIIDYYKSISLVFNEQKITVNYSSSSLKHFKLLEKILFDSVVLNLAFVRNFCVEKTESSFLSELLQVGLDNFLIETSNLSRLNKHLVESKKNDDKAFVSNCLTVQIICLIFGKYQNLERQESQSSINSIDFILRKKFITKFSQSDSCTILIEQMTRLLSKPTQLHAFFDTSYFLWILKFYISSFILKASDENEIRLEKKLLNYDLFTYIVFVILQNFEQLIFDSNFKNMNLLRIFRLKNIGKNEQSASEDEFKKVTNINSLKMLCLGVGCLHQLLSYVNFYLDYLNTYKLFNTNMSNQKEDVQEFLILINELLNFDELKQLFPLLMRFYCYNQHVYSNSLVKSIFLTNQLYLNTYKHCFEIVRKIRFKELDVSSDFVFSDTNATKNSSMTDSGTSVSSQSLNMSEIYNMYANTHTSYILKDVLTQFVNNDANLNRCVIDLLDSLMCECDKHEYLFHMNFALALANIATLDNYRLLDQRTKDLVGNMLNGVRRLCKKRPHLANKILFNIDCKNDRDQAVRNKRIKSELLSGSDLFMDSDSVSMSKTSTSSSSWSSLKSETTFLSYPSVGCDEAKESDDENFESIDQSPNITELTDDLKILIENEFLFCLHSIETCDEMKNLRDTSYWSCVFKNDYLLKIFGYLVDLFDSTSSNLSNDLKVNSWQIYNCLFDMKFSMDDKINYLSEMNSASETGRMFKLGVNIGFGVMKNEFFKSNECISLRQACTTDEFRKCLKEAYVKYLTGRLCVKSKKTRNAVFWVFNILKSLKLYLTKKSMNMDKNTNDVNQFNLTWNSSNKNPNSKLAMSSMLFQMKLIGLYHSFGMGIPLIPYTYELQQVFHSADFSRLLDIFGIMRTNRGFPFVPNDWLDSNKQKLNECLCLIEKCVCI